MKKGEMRLKEIESSRGGGCKQVAMDEKRRRR